MKLKLCYNCDKRNVCGLYLTILTAFRNHEFEWETDEQKRARQDEWEDWTRIFAPVCKYYQRDES